MGAPKKTKTIIPNRIVLLRKELNLSQNDLVIELKHHLGKNATISVSSLSHWESGHRTVPEKYVSALCEVLHCTPEYLYGLSSSKESHEPILKDSPTSTEEIPLSNLFMYDRKPIYVEFLDYSHENEWGIFSRSSNTLTFIEGTYDVSKLSNHNCRLYSVEPDYASGSYIYARKHILDLRKLMYHQQVYVKMNTMDHSVSLLYNGIYKHNETKTALINSEGLVLPYSGCNINYVCFPIGDMDSNEQYYRKHGKS